MESDGEVLLSDDYLQCPSPDLFDEEQLFEGLTQVEREDEARNACSRILLELADLVVVIYFKL
jgi:hypothetical protein